MRLNYEIVQAVHGIIKWISHSLPVSSSSSTSIQLSHDDIRQSHINVITTPISTESVLPSNYHNVYFTDDPPSMLWSYKDPRSVVHIYTTPIPFLFIEWTNDNGRSNETSCNYEQLKVPCRIEYWDPLDQQYKLHGLLLLSEHESESLQIYPTHIYENGFLTKLIRHSVVVSKSWRMVLEPYAYYYNCNDPNNRIQKGNAQVLVHISPILLAGSTCIDSLILPSNVNHLHSCRISCHSFHFDMSVNHHVNGSDGDSDGDANVGADVNLITARSFIKHVQLDLCGAKLGDINCNIKGFQLEMLDKCVVDVDNLFVIKNMSGGVSKIDANQMIIKLDRNMIIMLHEQCNKMMEGGIDVTNNSLVGHFKHYNIYNMMYSRSVIFVSCSYFCGIKQFDAGKSLQIPIQTCSVMKFGIQDRQHHHHSPHITWSGSVNLLSDNTNDESCNLIHIPDTPLLCLSTSYRHCYILSNTTIINRMHSHSLTVKLNDYSITNHIQSESQSSHITSHHFKWTPESNVELTVSWCGSTSSLYHIKVPSIMNNQYLSFNDKSSDAASHNLHKQIILKLTKPITTSTTNRKEEGSKQCFIIVCTMEWFYLTKNITKELIVMMTFSPVVVVANLMLHQIYIITSNNNDNGNKEDNTTNKFTVDSNGGFGDVIYQADMDANDGVDNNSVMHLNTHFIDSSELLFSEPLELKLSDLNELLKRNLHHLTTNDNYNLCSRLKQELSVSNDNCLSVCVNVSPWIVITNSTEHIHLVMSIRNDIYYLEADGAQFMPPHTTDPVYIGIVSEHSPDKVFWSKSFYIGDKSKLSSSADISNDNDTTNKSLPWIPHQTNSDWLIVNIEIELSNHTLLMLQLVHKFDLSSSYVCSNSLDERKVKRNEILIQSCLQLHNKSSRSFTIQPTINLCKMVHQSPIILDVDPGSSSHVYYWNMSSTDGAVEERQYYIVIINSDDGDNNDDDININTYLNINWCHYTNGYTQFFGLACLAPFDGHTNKNYLQYSNYYEAFCAHYISNHITLKSCDSIPIQLINLSGIYPIYVTQWLQDHDHLSHIINTISINNKCMPLWPTTYCHAFNKTGSTQEASQEPFYLQFATQYYRDINKVKWSDPIKIDNQSLDGSSHLSTLQLDNNTRIHLRYNSEYEGIMKIYLCSSGNKLIKLTQDDDNDDDDIIHSSFNINHLYIIWNEISLQPICTLILHHLTLTLSIYQSCSSLQHLLFRLGQLQLDNNLINTQNQYDFPVVLYTNFPDSQYEANRSWLQIHVTDTNSRLNIGTYSRQCFRCWNVSFDVDQAGQMEMYLEDIYLHRLIRVINQITSAVQYTQSETPLSTASSLDKSAPIKIIHINQLNISFINLIITLRSRLCKLYVSCDSSRLQLPQYNWPISQSMIVTYDWMMANMYHYYSSAILMRGGWMLGSMEMLGNPMGFIRYMGIGLRRLLMLDRGGTINTRSGLGLVDFCRYTSGGFIASVTGIANSLSRNMDYLTYDDYQSQRKQELRRERRMSGDVSGVIANTYPIVGTLWRGLGDFAISLLGAVGGLANHPIQESQAAFANNRSITMAMVTGLLKGLLGVVVKPLGSTAEFVAQTGEGLLQCTGVRVLRHHVVFASSSSSDKCALILVYPPLSQHPDDDDDHHHSNYNEPVVHAIIWESCDCTLFLTTKCQLIHYRSTTNDDNILVSHHYISYNLTQYHLSIHNHSPTSYTLYLALQHTSLIPTAIDDTSIAYTEHNTSVFLQSYLASLTHNNNTTEAHTRPSNKTKSFPISQVALSSPLSLRSSSSSSSSSPLIIHNSTSSSSSLLLTTKSKSLPTSTIQQQTQPTISTNYLSEINFNISGSSSSTLIDALNSIGFIRYSIF